MVQAPPLDSLTEQALLQAMAEHGVDPAWKGNVLRLHQQEDQTWRDKCCGGMCEPCVVTLCRVVDRVRELLTQPGPG